MKEKPINHKVYIPVNPTPFNKLAIGDEFMHDNERYKKVSHKESRSLGGGGTMILMDLSTSVGKVAKKRK